MQAPIHNEAPHAKPESQVVLAARDVTKSFGAVRALKGVNFDVHRGQVTTLFGENGAGKSLRERRNALVTAAWLLSSIKLV